MKPDFVAHTPKKGTDEWHSLDDHNAGVLERAKKYASVFGGDKIAELTARWHDLGKYNPDFQNYLERCHEAALNGTPAPEKGVPHAIYGAMLTADLGAEFLAPMIAGHHAGLFAPAALRSRINDPETRATFQHVLEAAERGGLPLELPADLAQTLTLPESVLELEMLLRFTFSALVDADFLDTEEHFNDVQTKLREPSSAFEHRNCECFLESCQHCARRGVACLRRSRDPRAGCIPVDRADGWWENALWVDVRTETRPIQGVAARHHRRAVHEHHRTNRARVPRNLRDGKRS
jgi:CRISPR-associated endonuclease Cas3-HD